jgi:hypothetical protein
MKIIQNGAKSLVKLYISFEVKLYLRTAFFWVITRRVVVISYRRFGITYRSHPRSSRIRKKAFRPQTDYVYKEECGR